MKRLITAVCALLMGAGLSYGGGLGLFVSQWSPDEADDSIGGGAKLTLDMGKALALELRGTYYEDLDDDDDAELQAIPVEAGLRINIPLAENGIVLYGAGGVGWYFLDAEVADVDVEVDDEVGWYAGGGLEIKLTNGLALFAEALYRGVEATATADDPEELEDISEDADLSGLTLNGGLVLTF